MFWKSCEELDIGSNILGGIHIPTFIDPVRDYLTYERIHTSFWFIPSISRFREALNVVARKYSDFDPFRPIMWKRGSRWYHLDTGAALYEPLKRQIYSFGQKEEKCFNHLYCGTQPGFVKMIPELERLHQEFKRDPKTLRTAWKIQKQFFKGHAL